MRFVEHVIRFGEIRNANKIWLENQFTGAYSRIILKFMLQKQDMKVLDPIQAIRVM
jgi:hypothetical protein